MYIGTEVPVPIFNHATLGTDLNTGLVDVLAEAQAELSLIL